MNTIWDTMCVCQYGGGFKHECAYILVGLYLEWFKRGRGGGGVNNRRFTVDEMKTLGH